MDLLLLAVFIINFAQTVFGDWFSVDIQTYLFDMANMATALLLAIYAFHRTRYIFLQRKILLYLLIIMEIWFITDYNLINMLEGTEYINVVRTITALVTTVIFLPLVFYQYLRKWPPFIARLMKRDGAGLSTKSPKTSRD